MQEQPDLLRWRTLGTWSFDEGFDKHLICLASPAATLKQQKHNTAMQVHAMSPIQMYNSDGNHSGVVGAYKGGKAMEERGGKG